MNKSDRYFQFRKNGRMGIQTADGKTVVPPIYDHVQALSDGVFCVTSGNQNGFVDLEGRLLFPLTSAVEYFRDFSEGLAAFLQNDRWGYIDKTGKEIIKPQFVFAGKFSAGLAVVRNEKGLHGAVDTTGKLVIAYGFPHLFPFHTYGHAIFSHNLKVFGLIDRLGNIVLPAEYVSMKFTDNDEVDLVKDDSSEMLTAGFYHLKTKEFRWDNRLAALNQERKIYRDWQNEAVKIIDSYHAKGCPCQFPRFVDAISMLNGSFQMPDWELLFSIACEKFENNPISDEVFHKLFTCPKCKSKYKVGSRQYNAFFDTTIVKVEIAKGLCPVGAPAKRPVPAVLSPKFLENHPPPRGLFKKAELATVISFFAP